MVFVVAMFYAKTMNCGVAINSLKITLILQLVCRDVKIDLACAHLMEIGLVSLPLPQLGNST